MLSLVVNYVLTGIVKICLFMQLVLILFSAALEIYETYFTKSEFSFPVFVFVRILDIIPFVGCSFCIASIMDSINNIKRYKNKK